MNKTVTVTLSNHTQHVYRDTRGQITPENRLIVCHYSDDSRVEYPAGSWIKIEIIPD